MLRFLQQVSPEKGIESVRSSVEATGGIVAAVVQSDLAGVKLDEFLDRKKRLKQLHVMQKVRWVWPKKWM